jgi:hypothetical protein
MSRAFAFILLATLAACGGGSTPAAPPAPAPTSTPTPQPAPSVNPFAAACGSPLPPLQDSYGFHVKVQLEPTKNKKILNASPEVRNPAYCEAAGFTGYTICNTRNENDPTRVPCDHYVTGIADTGNPGPNWFQLVNGEWEKCPGTNTQGNAPDCRLKDENQYLLDVFAGGTYKACGAQGSTGTCSNCILDQADFGVIHKSPAGLCKH